MRNGKLDHVPVRDLHLSEIHPSPENDELYRPIDAADPEIVALADSIRRDGVLHPLVLTTDRFILSGHRRYAACKLAGLKRIPCLIREDVSRAENHDEFMRLLRESNRQRVKGLDETLREEVVSVSPAEAYQSLIAHRWQRAALNVQTLDLGAYKGRDRISAAKIPFLNAIVRILNARQQFWPLSDRQIHYPLLNDPPLIHRSKPDSRYGNNLASYKALTNLLTRARLASRIPFACIADETRPVTVWDVYRDISGFVRQGLDDLLQGYWRDLLQSQPNHIELVIEKNTLLGILKPVAMEYTLPITSGRGYCSLAPRHAIAERFRKSGKHKLVLLLVSDFDPDGETIAQSFGRSMRDDFGIAGVEAIKVALTAAQVEENSLPPSMKAKAGCSTRQKFVAAHGEDVFEVEALEPVALQDIVRKAIDSVLDVDAFNAELDREKQDAAELESIRRRALLAIGEATKRGLGEGEAKP